MDNLAEYLPKRGACPLYSHKSFLMPRFPSPEGDLDGMLQEHGIEECKEELVRIGVKSPKDFAEVEEAWISTMNVPTITKKKIYKIMVEAKTQRAVVLSRPHVICLAVAQQSDLCKSLLLCVFRCRMPASRCHTFHQASWRDLHRTLHHPGSFQSCNQARRSRLLWATCLEHIPRGQASLWASSSLTT
eukprot:2532492-Rhodomonas_salina.2